MIAGIVASQNLVEAAPDVTAPTITSSNTVSVAENVTLAKALTANEAVTWSIVGGADQARFEISGSTLRWLSNGTKNFEAPDDADTNNTYVVTVRATDTALNTTDQTITATVTDADEVAPILSSATGTETGSTTADLSVSTDEGNGTLYWVVTQSGTDPTKAQVKLGQNHLGAAADDAGSQAVIGTGVQNISGGATGLSPSTAYFAHFMHEDASGNQSDVATSSTFTTDAPTPESHRYWRIFIETNNGDIDFIGANEVEMYEDAFGLNVVTGGTVIKSSEFSAAFAATKAFDGASLDTVQTHWASASSGGTDEWIGYDFGAGNDKEIVSVGIHAPESGQFDRAPAIIHVDYSDDGSAWTEYWDDTLSFTAGIQFRRSTHPDFVPTYTGSPYVAASFWRLYLQTANGAAFSAAEVEFRLTTGGADEATGGTPAVSASTLGSATSIFDDNNATFWALNFVAGAWIRYEFTAAKSIGEIAYLIRGDAQPTHSPNDFLVQFASGSGGPWSTAYQVRDQASWGDGEQRVFTSPDYI